MAGQVVESWVTGLQSRSAANSSSAAFCRSNSDSISEDASNRSGRGRMNTRHTADVRLPCRWPLGRRLRQLQERTHLSEAKREWRQLGSRMAFDLAEQNGVVSFLMARVCRALEACDAQAQPRATGDALFKLMFPRRKLVGRGPCKVQRKRPL